MVITNGVHGACKCVECKDYFDKLLSEKNSQLNKELISKKLINTKAGGRLKIVIQLLKDQKEVLLSMDCPEALLIAKQIDYSVNELMEIDSWLKI